MVTKRTKKQASRLILVNEAIGFSVVLALIWLNEVADLPALLFGMEKTPVNWSEIFLESTGVIILTVWIIAITARSLKRIAYLEGFLSMCASCKKIRVGKDWVPFEKYIGDRSDAVFSHGLCPECIRKYFEGYDEADDCDTHTQQTSS